MRFSVLGWVVGLALASGQVAAVEGPLTNLAASPIATIGAQATQSAEASRSAIAIVVEKKPDITEPEGEVKNKLVRYLEEKQVGRLNATNFLQHIVRRAVTNGVPANTIVLMILFPVVAALIAASRHLLGLRGFGIFTPAVLSVAFVAAGLISGLAMFLGILLVASIGRSILKRMKLHYLPRMALLLWFMSLGVFGLLYMASIVGIEGVEKLGIFPILILVLLAENFIEVQMGKSKKEAISLTMETLILAVISSLVLSVDGVQKAAILNPELMVGGVLVFDIFLGRYTGLRYLEYKKFQQLLKK